MLKYLFKASFENGKTYHQGADDVSLTDPKRSGFYDVLQMEKESRLLEFTLEGDGHRYGVNLTDGHFEVDGVPFTMHEGELHGELRLVFFRQHTHSFIVSAEKNRQVSHEIVYRMGWQTTVDGQNKQQVMQFK